MINGFPPEAAWRVPGGAIPIAFEIVSIQNHLVTTLQTRKMWTAAPLEAINYIPEHLPLVWGEILQAILRFFLASNRPSNYGTCSKADWLDRLSLVLCPWWAPNFWISRIIIGWLRDTNVSEAIIILLKQAASA